MKLINKVCRSILNYNEEKIVRQILDIADFDIIKNDVVSGKDIIAVMPTIYPHAGGETSALRIFHYLSENGFHVDVCCYDSDNTELMQKNAIVNVNGFGGKFISFNTAKQKKYNFCIMTNWISVYYGKKLSGYKIYFVQDYEPYFKEVGDQSCLAKKTYEFGLHIISLGIWNLKQINQNCITSSEMDFIDFPFEPNEYPYKKRDYSIYSTKKTIKLVIYIKRVGRRIPIIMQYLIQKTQKELAKSGIQLEAYFFGLNPKDKVFIGKNMGKLSKLELCQLYYKADFGMVASITNMSLVPMEMHACGLPLIEFIDGSYQHFLGKDTAILIDYDYKVLTRKLLHYLKHPSELEEMNTRARVQFKSYTWKNTCKQFKTLIDNIISAR